MLKVVTYNNDLLSQKSGIVDNISDEIKDLVNNMYKTMYFSNGIGLAAVQVGVLKRVIIMDVPNFGKYTMINPVITYLSKETAVFEEGCLSIPGISENVERARDVNVKYLDIDGMEQELNATGLLAVCVQHEIDHLDGVLFIDRLSPELRLKKVIEYKKLNIV